MKLHFLSKSYTFLLANTINTTVAQRLIRKLCEHCKTNQKLASEDWPIHLPKDQMPETTFVPIGCDQCHFTGYKGRLALYEVIPIDEELAMSIKNIYSQIQDLLSKRNIKDLATRALETLNEGTTSLDEVYALLTGF